MISDMGINAPATPTGTTNACNSGTPSSSEETCHEDDRRTVYCKEQKEGVQGASFFFSSTVRSLHHPQNVAPTLTFELAKAKDAFKAVIVEVLECEPGVPYESLLARLEF
jgi:hypothetical protein